MFSFSDVEYCTKTEHQLLVLDVIFPDVDYTVDDVIYVITYLMNVDN